MGNRRRALAKDLLSHLDEGSRKQLRAAAWDFAKNQVNTDTEALDLTRKRLERYAGEFLADNAGTQFWPQESNHWEWTNHTYMDNVVHLVAEMMQQEQQGLIPRRRRQQRHTGKTSTIKDSFRVTKPSQGSGRTRVSAPKAATHLIQQSTPPHPSVVAEAAVVTGLEEEVHGPQGENSSDDDCIVVDVPDVVPAARPITRDSSRPMLQRTSKEAESQVEDELRRSNSRVKGKERAVSPLRPASRLRDDGSSSALKKSVEDAGPPPNVHEHPTRAREALRQPSPSMDGDHITENQGDIISEEDLAELVHEIEGALRPQFSPITDFERSSPPAAREDEDLAATIVVEASEVTKRPADQLAGEQLIQAPVMGMGLSFRPEQLAQLPDCLLSYLHDLRNKSIQCAESTQDPAKALTFDLYCTLYNELYTDLESRIKSLSHDAPELHRQVASISRRRLQLALKHTSVPGHN